ncbi:MAG TPA: hypothetical protein VGC09_17445 [Rhodopila sp.]
MRTSRRLAFTVIAMVCGIGGMRSQARAAYIVTVTQDGDNVVASGSGSIDTSGLAALGVATEWGFVANGFLITGPTAPVVVQNRTGFNNITARFGGTPSLTTASFGTGDVVGIVANSALFLPDEYVSGAALSSSATWDDATLAGLNLTPGDYTWTWGEGAHADRYELVINSAAPVPEPASMAVLGLPAAVMILRRGRRAAA